MAQYTEQQKSAFKLMYAERRKRQFLISAPIIAIVLAVSLTRHGGSDLILGVNQEIAGPMFVLVVVGALLFSRRNWRCPACDTYLGKNFNPKHCPSCGVELHA